jgi:very-short-patch-repair endonuclease
MGDHQQPFIGSEALTSGALNRYELRRDHRALMPNVYLDRQIEASLRQRTAAAWLWSGREAVVAGLAAAAVHGTKWVDDDAIVELIWKNARPPNGVVTRDDLLLEAEYQRRQGLPVTTPERTAFDLGRRGPIGMAVARLDALAAATPLKPCDVLDLAAEHRRARGLRQLEQTLDLMDGGAESPKETWLRLLAIRAGYPRPHTQIPVARPDGWGHYYLDMGWEEFMLALEYDGEQHWDNPKRIAYDIKRAEDVHDVGWNVVRVMKEHRAADVLSRLRRAWERATG